MMADFKTTFISALLLHFSCSFLIGCAQQYEEDYSAAVKYSNWQSARTTRVRSDASDSIVPSRIELKNSSPDVVMRSRSRNSRYEAANKSNTRRRYETQRSDNFSDDIVDSKSERLFRQRQRNQQQTLDTGRRAVYRRNDEIEEANTDFQNSGRSLKRGETRGGESTTIKVVRRRKPSRFENNNRKAEERIESRLQDEQSQIALSSMRMTVPHQETDISNISPERKFHMTNTGRQRGKEEAQTDDIQVRKTQKPISRSRARIKIIEKPRKSDRYDKISESDNYPIEFLERIKNSDQGTSESDQMPVRSSRLRQREAKSYQVVGGESDVTRFQQKYARLRPAEKSSKSEKNLNVSMSAAEHYDKGRDLSRNRKNSVHESRPRSRNRFVAIKNTTGSHDKQKIYRDYSRGYTLPRTSSTSRQLKLSKTKLESQRVLDDKFETLKPAENKFYQHPADRGRNNKCSRGCKKAVAETTYEKWENMKILDVELQSDGSEEQRQIEAANVTEGKWESRRNENLVTTTLQETDSGTETSTEISTVSTIPTTISLIDNRPSSADTVNAKGNHPTETILPSTRHRFSSKFNQNMPSSTGNMNLNTDFLISTTPTPIDLTSLFDETPDSTLSIMTLFNNSFVDSTSVAPAINQINPLDQLFSTITTEITNTNNVKSSTRSPIPTNNATKGSSSKKKSKIKKSKKSNKVTTAEPHLNPLDNSPILRNIVSLFAFNPDTTTKKSVAGKKKDSKSTAVATTITVPTATEAASARITTFSTTTTTSTASPGPLELEKIQNYINETMKIIQNKTGFSPQIHDAPRMALDSLTPETVLQNENATETPVLDITMMITTESMPNTTDTSQNNLMSNVTSQYVYFNYTSAPFQDKSRISTTADYFVYGVYPNNTVVRKRAWKIFDYEKYQSPYVIFGIYPNNTIVKKFPNGTIINDEYMTSDNEIKYISDNQRRVPTISAAITTAQTTTNNDKLGIATTPMKMGSRLNEIDDSTTTEISLETLDRIQETSSNEIENKTEKFENETTESISDIENGFTTTRIFEVEGLDETFEGEPDESDNDIEKIEEKDEEKNALLSEVPTTTIEVPTNTTEVSTTTTEVSTTTTEVPTTTTEVPEDKQFRINIESNYSEITTTEFQDNFRATTTEVTLRFNFSDDDEPTTKSAESTTESSVTMALNGNGDGNSFLFDRTESNRLNQIESKTAENIFTTTIGSRTETTTTADQDDKARTSNLYDTDLSTTTENTVPTTKNVESTETRTTDRTDNTTADFDPQQIFLSTTMRYEDSTSLDTVTEAAGAEEYSTTAKSKFLTNLIDDAFFTSTVSGGRTGEETTTLSNLFNEVEPRFALTETSENENEKMKSTIEQDEQPGLVNLAFRSLSSSDTATHFPKHSSTTTRPPKFITSTMKSMYISEKKIKVKMKRKSTTTPKSTTGKQNVFIVTPNVTLSDNYTDVSKKGKVKFVTLTPGVVVTTDVKDENDVLTMSSQHIQKVTKAPANIPKNFLKNVVVEIEEKSSSPIPEILKNVEKELQGNGLSVSLARRIIEMAVERAITTEILQTTTQTGETAVFPFTTTTSAETTITGSTTEPTTTTLKPTTTITTAAPSMTTIARTESTTTNEISTIYNELLNTVNVNSLSVGFLGEYRETTTNKMNEDAINELVQNLWQSETQATTLATTTTTKSRSSSRNRKAKTSRNLGQKPVGISTLSESDKQLLEAILKQQNSNLSIQELDKIIENQIRLAEEVRKASKNTKKKPRLTTTTTTTTTTQTPPLFGFLFSLFSDNSSPSRFSVTRAPLPRSRSKSNRSPGSMANTTKSIKKNSLKVTQDGNQTGERSTRGDLVTAAIDVTKAVSKFMGTVISSAAHSFQAFFTNFGRGR